MQEWEEETDMRGHMEIVGLKSILGGLTPVSSSKSFTEMLFSVLNMFCSHKTMMLAAK